MNAKHIFENNTLVRCDECNTPTDERYKIGDKYYCHPDYERVMEKPENRQKQIEANRFQRFVNIVYD